ncbi:hypothetical protein ATI61_119175 [Archangium gephyra]|uniref:Uncharacterized protein n=1 Tax=Archangium gephyra TaxID=48 RepID=A0ABX9JMV4_9BACT|nr:hypothetical protein [Archangium gephyra]REG22643.1 hypothetical protein ATI61_119175 [Archangium gephyra]
MRIELQKLVRHDWKEAPEYAAVDAIAEALHRELQGEAVLAQIQVANAPGNSSERVQQTFLAHAERLGFRREHQGQSMDFVGVDPGATLSRARLGGACLGLHDAIAARRARHIERLRCGE